MKMWRAILLGKIALAIIVCIAGAVICFNVAGDEKLTLAQSIRWYALSLFFLLVMASFSVVVYLLFRRKMAPSNRDQKINQSGNHWCWFSYGMVCTCCRYSW